MIKIRGNQYPVLLMRGKVTSGDLNILLKEIKTFLNLSSIINGITVKESNEEFRDNLCF